jgi:hypothetical protein
MSSSQLTNMGVFSPPKTPGVFATMLPTSIAANHAPKEPLRRLRLRGQQLLAWRDSKPVVSPRLAGTSPLKNGRKKTVRIGMSIGRSS